MSNYRFKYNWNLSDGFPAPNIQPNNLNVFGTFICGGGSTMGYKLAGFNHLGGVEIDPEVADVYKTNHKPKHLYNMDIRDFNKLQELPKELYQLDILDGSPPCSTFSMAGSREKAWGKEKQFREGQAVQTLDDLVFVYCDTIVKLQPKVFILENVKGIIQGNAKLYSKQIVEKMTKAGYCVQVFCLNAASMGVPQKRERVFFIGYKKDLAFPKLKLEFNEKPILYKNCAVYNNDKPLGKYALKYWNKRKDSDKSVMDSKSRVGLHLSDMSCYYLKENEIVPTFTAKPHCNYSHPSYMSKDSFVLCGTFPIDYNFKKMQAHYLIAMSVPL